MDSFLLKSSQTLSCTVALALFQFHNQHQSGSHTPWSSNQHKFNYLTPKKGWKDRESEIRVEMSAIYSSTVWLKA